MTTITLDLRDSGGSDLQGFVIATLDYWVMKDDQAVTFTPHPRRFELVNGEATLDLEPTVTEGVSYSFQIWVYDELVTEDPETGDPITIPIERQILPTFRAMVPASLTPISFNALARQTGINRDNKASALTAIIQRLYKDNLFWENLFSNIYKARGAYTANTWYGRGDVVTLDGGSYIYINVNRSQNVHPTTVTHWQQIAARGLAGSGTTGVDEPYDGMTWNGSLDAPSRNAVRDILEQKANVTTVDGLAPLASPIFTGQPRRQTPPAANDNTSEIPTTAWVQALVATVSKAIVPVGTVLSFGGTSAPTGWLFCDGRTVSRTTYAALFAIVGTAFNTGGEAGTDFRLPDLRGRAVMSPDAMGINGAANRLTSASGFSSTNLGTAGGSETVTLTINEIPSHSHPPFSGFTTFFGAAAGGGATLTGGSGYAAMSGTGNTGGGLPHRNIPPTQLLNAIIYTGL